MSVRTVVILLSVICLAQATPVMFIIQSQQNKFHLGLAERTRENIVRQWQIMAKSQQPPQVIFTSEVPEISEFSWTYFPMIEFLAKKLEENPQIDFVGILREDSELDLGSLGKYAKNNLGKFNPKEESYFFGKGLKDETPTIVHHFHQNTEEETILFPDPEAGIFVSRHLVLSLRDKLSAVTQDFSIDPEFELSKFLLQHLNVKLTHIPELCAKAPKNLGDCIIHPRLRNYKCLKTKETEETKTLLDSIFTVVSTVQKFHNSRVSKILETFGDLLPNAQFISNVEEELAPGIRSKVLPHTVNTENGHCNKTRTMIDSFLDSDKDWMLIIDDDTILSPSRFAQLLACYDIEDPIILGQRYGYGSASGVGYNYLTGGGGKVINRAAASKIVNLEDKCGCPKEDTPEDMHIFGICAKRAGVQITHSARMFQARPADYPAAMIQPRKPISFHKHWEVDPVHVYDEWFRKSDDHLRTASKPAKEEL